MIPAGPALSPNQLASLFQTVRRVPCTLPLQMLVRDMNALDKAARSAGYPRDVFVAGALGGRRLSGAHLDSLTRIRKTFREFSISLFPLQPTRVGWTASYALTDSKGRVREDEITRILGLLIWKAATSGVLWRVRECQTCAKWIAVRRMDHKFCSTLCREKDFRSSDSGRRKRAEYMRRYRATQKRMKSQF